MFLLGLLCLIPFVQSFHSAPISSMFAEWQSFLVLWAALLVACFHGNNVHQSAIPKISLAGLVLLVSTAIQFSIWPPEYAQQIILPMCYFFSLSAAIQLGFWLRQRDLVELSVLWLAVFFVVGAAYTVAVQFVQLPWQYFSCMPFMIPRLAGHNPYGNIGQTNHVATYLAIGWAAAYYLYCRSKFRFSLYLPFSSLLFAGIILTGQRSGFIYVVCLSALFWFFPMSASVNGTRPRRSIWICGMPPLYLLLSYVLHVVFHYLGSEFTTASERLNTGWNGRLDLWQIGWSLFKESPLFGIGWGRLASYEFLKADVLPTTPANHVHNIVLQLLAETGIFCTVAVLTVVGLWLRRFLKFPSSPEKQFVLGVVIILGLHSMVEYPLWYAYFLLPLGVLAGMFESSAIPLKFPPMLTNVIVKGMSFVAMGVLFYSFFEAIYVTDMYGRRTVNFYSRSLRAAELKEIAQMPSKFFLRPYIDYIDSTGRILNSENLSENMALNQRLLNTMIDNNVIVRQSIYLAMSGRDAEAKTTFLRMKKIFPERAPEMLGVLQHTARLANNENLTAFSKWAAEAASQK